MPLLYIYVFLVFEFSVVESQSSFCLRYYAKFTFWKRSGHFWVFCSFPWCEADICIHLKFRPLIFFPGNSNVCFDGGLFQRGLVFAISQEGRKMNRRKPDSCLVLLGETWCDISLCCFTHWLVRGEGKECR